MCFDLYYKNKKIMIAFTYSITAVLFTSWAVGFFNFHIGREIHLLLMLALVSLSVIIMRDEHRFLKKKLKMKEG
jgi:hypothetical protein